MQKYLGTKLIEAEPLNLGDYNQRRGWTIPENEDPSKEGYYIVYPDGYVSWSPKDIFEEAYRPTTGLSFGLAVEALKKGHRVCRQGWNGKNMYLILYRGQQDIAKAFGYGFGEGQGEFSFVDVIAMKTAQDTMVLGWLASQTDMLAEDWNILQ